VQIHSDAEVLGSHTGLSLGLAFGGVDYEKQRHHLERGVTFSSARRDASSISPSSG